MDQINMENINASLKESESTQIPIFDRDYWYDQSKNIKTEKSLQNSSVSNTEKTIIQEIDDEINKTNEGFNKITQVSKLNHIKKQKHLSKLTNPHLILKEGRMRKKTDGFIFTWRDRYIVLTPEKLISFEDDKKEKVIGCINLKILHTTVRMSEDGIVLDFNGECENMILQVADIRDLMNWKELIQNVVEYHSKQNKILLKTMNKFIYDQKDVLTQKQFMKEAETGDILLFYTQNFGAKMQRFLTNSDFDHVAMVVKLKNKQLMVFQSNQMHGVSLYQWKQYISYFDLYGKVTLRKLNYIRKSQAQTKLLAFMKKNLGKKYEISAYKLLKLQSDFNWQNVQEDRGYFCSELIAKALKSISLLDDKRSSGRYWPVDFAESNNLQLKKGATLGSQQTVILNKHTKKSL